MDVSAFEQEERQLGTASIRAENVVVESSRTEPTACRPHGPFTNHSPSAACSYVTRLPSAQAGVDGSRPKVDPVAPAREIERFAHHDLPQ
jgi:hypothetical protein